MVSPWSSSAVHGLHGCGINAERFEMLRRYAVPKGVDAKVFAEGLLDRMTEQIYDKQFTTFMKPVAIPKVKLIRVLECGRDGLREINKEMDLGWDDQDIEIYYKIVIEKMRRDPTDALCFLWGQVNSDHCRHTNWRAQWTIDGVVQERTLLEEIQQPYLFSPSNAKVAFHDNSSDIDGFKILIALPESPWTSSEYVIVTVHADGTLTFETHNFPTGVAPYPGAATGTGGRMRDQKAIGRGGLLRAACAGFFTGNLNLSGYRLPWEKRGQEYPGNLARAVDIIRRASDGACEYNNPVGEPVILGSSRSLEMPTPDGVLRAWFKPIMSSGGIGIAFREHVKKQKPEKGMLIVMIGGPAFPIGFGGGSASSRTSGDNKVELDFNAVQRGDPEMAIRDHRVIDACVALRKKNPIVLIHDQGAGGVINNLAELVEKTGGVVNAGMINLGDKFMPFVQRIGAEFQERYGLIIKSSGLKLFKRICKRENCPVEVLGKITGDARFVVSNNIKGDNPKPIDVDLKHVLTGMPQKQFSDVHVKYNFKPLTLPRNISIESALNRVLRNLAVASKEHYTLKGDRSVGGLVVGQQHCGPANLPIADCGIMALSHYSPQGMVISTGEQPLKLMIDPKAGARMAATEAVLNAAGAVITSIGDLKSSVNWMWPLKYKGEAAAIFDACRSVSEFLHDFGQPVRGKDSSSMIVRFADKVVPCPRQVIITMQAMMPNVRKFVTPDIKQPGQSDLLLIDLGLGKNRMGGSILAQCYRQWGNDCPDIEPSLLREAFNAVQELVRRDLILSYHDRSDGGLIVTLLEMIFAGNCGFEIGIDCIDEMETLFCEEAGAVVEVASNKTRQVMQMLEDLRVPVSFIGRTTREKRADIFTSDGCAALIADMTDLRQVWRETSYQLRKLQINPACALEEKRSTKDRRGISYVFPKDWNGKSQFAIGRTQNQPKVAILREVGTNSEQEMVASFKLAGFRTVDVSMADLENGTVKNLNWASVLAVCGGFSNGDVLGSARIWAAKIRHNQKLFRAFWEFMMRQDTLSYWVCNGAQLAGQLGWIPYLPKDGKPEGNRPIFTHNTSRKFESRWSLLEIEHSASIMLRGLEGSRLGAHVAHGEGRAFSINLEMLSKALRDRLVPARFVNDEGMVATEYPYNPNGSELGIASLCTPDGRHLAIMPHLERSTQMRQWQYIPEDLKKLENSPWLRAFINLRDWCR